jgi:hypothetical protein
MKRHYIIRFNDLSNEKQEEILLDLSNGAMVDADLKTLVLENVHKDDVVDVLEVLIERATDKSWCEWEVVLE